MQPTFDSKFACIAGVRVIQGEIVLHVAVHADVPGVAGCLGIVKDEAAGRTLAYGLLELIEPSSVVSHVPATEKRSVVIAGVIDHGYHYLSLDVDVFIVIPSIFRSIYAESAEDILGALDLHHVGCPRRPHHDVLGITQADLLLSFGRQRSPDGLGRDGDHAERLEPAVAESRLEAKPLQLVGKVVHRKVLVLRHGLTAAELVRGQGLDPFAQQHLVAFPRREILPHRNLKTKQATGSKCQQLHDIPAHIPYK